MSPFDGAAGFSDWTREKYDLVDRVLTAWAPKAKAVAHKHGIRFVFVDPTSGPGHVNGMAGTPMMLRQLANEFEAPMLAFEQDEQTYERLRDEVGPVAVCADSLEFLRDEAALRQLPRFGLLIYDPNPRDGLLPVEELAAWGRGNRRDLLAFVAANQAYKRTGHATDLEPHVRTLERTWTGVCMTQPRTDKQWVAIFATRWAALASDVCRLGGFDLVNEPQGKEWLRCASTVGAGSGVKGQMVLEIGGIFPYE
jgi:hypothetical protein